MEQRQLGRTGTWVSQFGLGTANFGASTDEREGAEIIRAALDAGVTYVDTANAYGKTPGAAEEIVGRALEGRRDEVVLATKVASAVGEAPNDRGAGRRHILMQCEASLRRLRTEWIDLYQLHAWDPTTPLEETLSALDQLVGQGKVRYVGTSNFAAWQIVDALWTADRRGFASGPVTEQAHYSLLHRTPELELLPMAVSRGVGILVYSPLSGGILTGKYQDGIDSGTRFATEPAWAEAIDPLQLRAVVTRLSQLANDAALTLQQLALGWAASRHGVASVILGPRTVGQLRENLGALSADIDAALRQQIDAVVSPGTTVTP